MSAAILRILSILLALTFATMAGEQPYPRTIAVIWDSAAARTPQESRVGQMLGPVLARLGLRARYYDVRRPLPDLRSDRDIRAVMTFFDRDRMPDPNGYVDWVESLTAKGKYFVCLGDPGIDHDDQGRPTTAAVRTRFWKLLGLLDSGRWEAVTYDHRVLVATSLIGFERQIGPVLPPYRVTLPASPGLESHLIVGTPNKTKHIAPPAHLVLTGPQGGYAAIGYTHCEPEPGRRQWYIDPAVFLDRAFHVTDSPKPDPTVVCGRQVLLIVAQRDTQPTAMARRGPKFEARVQRLADEFPELPISLNEAPVLDPVRVIRISTEDFEQSARASRLRKTLRDAQTHRVLPNLIEDHQADWKRADTALITKLDSMTWTVEPGLTTVRFDHADQLQVDPARSMGVIGSTHRDGSLFVALDSDSRKSLVALNVGARPTAPFPFLEESRWRVSGVRRSATELRCRVKGYGPGDMTWHVPQAGEWWVEVPATGRKYCVNVGPDRVLTTTIPLSAVNGLEIVLRRRS